jgi:hypothetical protein
MIKTIYKKTKLYKIVKNSERYCLLAAFCQFHHNAIKIILNLKNDLGSSEAERKVIHKYRKTRRKVKKENIWKDKTILGERRKNDYTQRHKNREKVKKKIYGKIKQY